MMSVMIARSSRVPRSAFELASMVSVSARPTPITYASWAELLRLMVAGP